MTNTPTMDQIRAAIDSGKTGEKVAFPDPAAAPLGTDAEAGGHGATPADRALEANTKHSHRERHPPLGFAVYLAAIAFVGLAALLIILVAT